MTSELSPDKTDALLSTATAIRQHFRRAVNLGAEDVSAIGAEPVIEALGWNMRDPRNARRQGGGVVTLLSRGRPALRIRALGAHDTLPGSLGEGDLVDATWIVLTNGVEWAIFNARNPGRAFRTFSLSNQASARDSLEILALLDYDVFKPDALAEAWMAEAMDADIIRSLLKHLDASPELIAVLHSDLKGQGISIPQDDIRAALTRIDISMGSASEEPASEAVAEVAPTKAKPAGAGKAKSTKSKVKPAAKAATKSSAKPSAKTTTKAAGKLAPKTGKVPTASKSGEPILPEGMAWPDGAPYVMQRKGACAFASHDGRSGKVTLHPGSLIAGQPGKTLLAPLRARRIAGKEDGTLAANGEMLEITQPLEFDGHRAAASFVSGTDVREPEVWRTRDGKTLADKLSKQVKSSSDVATTAKTEEAPEPAAQAAQEEAEVV